MGMFCSIWGCADEPVDFWGDNAEYVLYRCKRCGNETIFCSKELKLLKNDQEGRKVMSFMMSNPEFSRDCTIHSEFVKAETDNPFSYSKQEKQQDKVREKYGLPSGFRQPDPVILWKKGLWKPKEESGDGENRKPRKKSTPKGKKGKSIRINDGENPPKDTTGNLFEDNRTKDTFNFEINYVPKNGENKSGGESTSWNVNEFYGTKETPSGFKPEMTPEAQLNRLQRRLEKHVAREEYEKAAKIRDQIDKLKSENK